MNFLEKIQKKIQEKQNELVNPFDDQKKPGSKFPTKAKVISLLNQKGGVGKTTMTFHLAHALAKKNYRVLCLDLDPQANLSQFFGATESANGHHILHLLINSVRELKAIHSSVMVRELIQSKHGIDVIASGNSLSAFDLTFAGISSPRQLVLKKFLEQSQLLNDYDFILIDGPPTLGLIVVNILCASHGIFVPFVPDRFSRAGIEQLALTLKDVEEMGISQTPKVLGYIPNLLDQRRRLTQDELDKLPTPFASSSDELFFSNRVHLANALAKGKSVFDYEAKEYRDLQDKFLALAAKAETLLNPDPLSN
jgi:chromosome partitioning protein